MHNFNTPNKTPIEISVIEDNSHFERDFVHTTSV